MAKPIHFEKSMHELEEIVVQLEKGELPLEDCLKQFEKGVKLARQCQEVLAQAQQRIETLAAPSMKNCEEIND